MDIYFSENQVKYVYKAAVGSYPYITLHIVTENILTKQYPYG